jgi:hypothetical protein
MQNFDHNIGFWEKRQFFRRKLSKIAENCDHNIDPRTLWELYAEFLKAVVVVLLYIRAQHGGACRRTISRTYSFQDVVRSQYEMSRFRPGQDSAGLDSDLGSMLWSQFSAILTIFGRKIGVFLKNQC